MDWIWHIGVSAGIGFVVGWAVWSVVQAEKITDNVATYALLGACVGVVLGLARGSRP